MQINTKRFLIVFIFVWKNVDGFSSPLKKFGNYSFSIEFEKSLVDLWWSIDLAKNEITFEIHGKTNGWLAFGISPAGGMSGADIALAWIDSSGNFHLEDRYATGNGEPMADETTVDWTPLAAREENGWIAVQFKRFLETCDQKDVPIKSGTNILIFAYSNVDPVLKNGKFSIEYHENRRYTRIIPLQTFNNIPDEGNFQNSDFLEFKINNFSVPTSTTTYFCQIFKVPSNFTQRRHAVAYKILIDQNNSDLVHHLLTYECNAAAVYDDKNLPFGLCDEILKQIEPCAANIAIGWAVGGNQFVEYPEVAGYPMGGDFEIKYYLLQMHYDNPKMQKNRTDSSGIRFYLGSKLRENDLGYLTLGTAADVYGLAIPPNVDRFLVDSFCPSEATALIPSSGINVFSAFPHTHLQGRTLWTKIIRNKKAVQYLFNAESYDFNYQFENRFPKTIKLNRGDELATRCVYSTKNKNQTTIGGEATTDEMCLHMFTYYPRMSNFAICQTFFHSINWQFVMNVTKEPTSTEMIDWFQSIKWNNQTVHNWQKFYNESARVCYYGFSPNFQFSIIDKVNNYTDLVSTPCKKNSDNYARKNQPIHLIFHLFIFKLFF